MSNKPTPSNKVLGGLHTKETAEQFIKRFEAGPYANIHPTSPMYQRYKRLKAAEKCRNMA